MIIHLLKVVVGGGVFLTEIYSAADSFEWKITLDTQLFVQSEKGHPFTIWMLPRCNFMYQRNSVLLAYTR